MKKYVLIEEDFDIYSFSFKKISPVLKIHNNILLFNGKEFKLNGLTLKEWLSINGKLLTHTIPGSGKEGSNDEVYSYNDKMILKEVFLDENEDYYINYKIDEQTYKKDISQLNLLLSDLEQLFHFIEPEISNENTYSIFIRDLIIKSATEVETHWKELMRLNGYQKKN